MHCHPSKLTFLALFLCLACSSSASKAKPAPTGRMVPVAELPEDYRAAARSWKVHGEEWLGYRERAKEDPALARFLVDNLIDVMVDSYTSSRLTTPGELAGPFELAQRDLVALSHDSQPVLLELMTVNDNVVAYLAVDTLALMDDPALAPLAAEVLERPEVPARRRAAELLARTPNALDREPEVMLALERALLEDPDWSVRSQAAVAVGARGFWSRDSTTPRRMLTLALTDEDPMVVESATKALGQLADPAAVPALIDALERLGQSSERARTVRVVQLTLRGLTGERDNKTVAGWREWQRRAGSVAR